MSETDDTIDDAPVASAPDPVALSADIVAAYVSHNSLPVSELAGLIARVHQAVAGLGSDGGVPAAPAAPEVEKPTPAQVRKSITPDGIVSFLDGKSYKTMKRHLTKHGLTPQAYRQRYDLPGDYPMVAPSYAAQRSALAKSIGLGVPGGRAGAQAPDEDAAPEPKRRGRKAA